MGTGITSNPNDKSGDKYDPLGSNGSFGQNARLFFMPKGMANMYQQKQLADIAAKKAATESEAQQTEENTKEFQRSPVNLSPFGMSKQVDPRAMELIGKGFYPVMGGPNGSAQAGGQAGGTPIAMPLDPEGKKAVNDVGVELASLKNAHDFGTKNGLFGSTPKNLIGNLAIGTNASGIPGVGPLIENRIGPAKQYDSLTRDATLKLAKILSGSKPAESIAHDLLSQRAQQGVTQEQADRSYNAQLSGAQARMEGLISDYTITHGPLMGKALRDTLEQQFGKYMLPGKLGRVQGQEQGGADAGWHTDKDGSIVLH